MQQKLEWANEDKARLLEKSKTSTATQLPKTRNIPQGAVSDSKLKHQIDYVDAADYIACLYQFLLELLALVLKFAIIYYLFFVIE